VRGRAATARRLEPRRVGVRLVDLAVRADAGRARTIATPDGTQPTIVQTGDPRGLDAPFTKQVSFRLPSGISIV
jgi:hypothetical protein